MPEKQEINDVVETLAKLQEDTTVPKNVKLKIQKIVSALKESLKELG